MVVNEKYRIFPYILGIFTLLFYVLVLILPLYKTTVSPPADKVRRLWGIPLHPCLPCLPWRPLRPSREPFFPSHLSRAKGRQGTAAELNEIFHIIIDIFELTPQRPALKVSTGCETGAPPRLRASGQKSGYSAFGPPPPVGLPEPNAIVPDRSKLCLHSFSAPPLLPTGGGHGKRTKPGNFTRPYKAAQAYTRHEKKFAGPKAGFLTADGADGMSRIHPIRVIRRGGG